MTRRHGRYPETREEAEERKTQAFETLRKLLPPGKKVYTVLMHVSRSGMHRAIKVVVPYIREPVDPERPEGIDVWDISGMVARVTGRQYDDDRGGVITEGAGMDMGFEVVYTLGHALYPNGFPAEEGYWRNRQFKAGEIETDGGYALKQVWL